MAMLNEINISKNFENYSQRNNKLLPHVSCGPTNMIQALEYAGWEWNNKMFPELEQPEDKLLKFTRTNTEVLNYYKKRYEAMYKNWIEEAKSLQKEGQELWEVNCKKSYAPNEVHDVMNFATNAFLGYSEEDIKNEHFATVFFPNFSLSTVIHELEQGLPVVTSVRFGNSGHYITIVGFQWKGKYAYTDDVENFIIDNTYGKFNFKTETYETVSGNDNLISKKELLERVRPAMHLFRPGALTI